MGRIYIYTNSKTYKRNQCYSSLTAADNFMFVSCHFGSSICKLSDGHRRPLFPSWQPWRISIIDMHPVKTLWGTWKVYSLKCKLLCTSISHFKGARNPNLGPYVAGSQHNKLIGTANGSAQFHATIRKGQGCCESKPGYCWLLRLFVQLRHLFTCEESPLKNC